MLFLSEEMRRNPYPVYQQLRSQSPVLPDPQGRMWTLLDYESVKRALTDHESFSSSVTPPSGKPPDWLVFSDPPRHTVLRNFMVQALPPRSIPPLEPGILQLSNALIDRVIEQGEMDLVADYASPLPARVIAEVIGIPAADQSRFLHWNEELLQLSAALQGTQGGFDKIHQINAHAAVSQELWDYIRHLIERRRQWPAEDLLSRLAATGRDGEKLSLEEIMSLVQQLFSAATETTTNMLANAMLCFIEHPDQKARLEAEPGLLTTAIEEVLRFRSPVQALIRETRQEVELQGQRIPAGKFILVGMGSANHDPQYFKDPERFDIGRDPNPHIAFGYGIHFCLGALLARLEARIAIPNLLTRLKGLQRASSDPWPPHPSLHVLGPASLPVRFAAGAKMAKG